MKTSGATGDMAKPSEERDHWHEETFGFVLYDALTDTLYEGNEEGSGILKMAADGAPQIHVANPLRSGAEGVAGLVGPLLDEGIVVET